MVKDADLKADKEKAGFQPTPATGREVQDAVFGISSIEPALAETITKTFLPAKHPKEQAMIPADSAKLTAYCLESALTLLTSSSGSL